MPLPHVGSVHPSAHAFGANPRLKPSSHSSSRLTKPSPHATSRHTESTQTPLTSELSTSHDVPLAIDLKTSPSRTAHCPVSPRQRDIDTLHTSASGHCSSMFVDLATGNRGRRTRDPTSTLRDQRPATVCRSQSAITAICAAARTEGSASALRRSSTSSTRGSPRIAHREESRDTASSR